MRVMGRQKLVWRLDLFSEGAGAIYAARLSNRERSTASLEMGAYTKYTRRMCVYRANLKKVT